MTASRLRLVLSLSLFAIASLATLIALIAYTELRKVAIDVSHTTVDANASQNNLQNLLKVQQQLDKDQAVINRTSNIVAESRSYQYQDQIIADLKSYANQAGITITNIDFASASKNSSPLSPSKVPTAPVPNGIKTTLVAITLKNPIDYNSLLRFLKSIEQNLTKMQVSKISLVKGTGNQVSSEALTIEVYIK